MGFKRERRLTKIGRRTYNLGYDWRRSQEVRRGSAKPLYPGSSPGAASITLGRLAQLAERLLDVQKVGGSSPPPPTQSLTPTLPVPPITRNGNLGVRQGKGNDNPILL